MHDGELMNSIGLGKGQRHLTCNMTLDVYCLQVLDGILSSAMPCVVVRILIVLTGALSLA